MFIARNANLMLTANVRKIEKSVMSNISFILDVLSESGITFVWIGFFHKKNGFFKMKLLCVCVNMRKYFMSRVSIVCYITFK